jgi:FlaA1/EpsC-like NDP-sugar epimerase
VRIADLARQLIQLSGLRPEEDIRIEYTGIRPGEKLFEELNVDEETVQPTYHEKVKIFAGISLPGELAAMHLKILRDACERRDRAAVVAELERLVPDYTPSEELTGTASAAGLARLAAAVAKDRGASYPEAAETVRRMAAWRQA